MAKRSKIEGLPLEVKRWLERCLTESGFSGYEALEAMLGERGYQISKSAIHRYGQKIERRFAAIKASTEAARMLTEGAADDQDSRSEAVIALVQTEIFESLINLQEASADDLPSADRIKLLSAAAANIAALSRASVNLKRFQSEVRAKINAKLAAMEQAAGSGDKVGFDLETLRRVREEIYGIV